MIKSTKTCSSDSSVSSDSTIDSFDTKFDEYDFMGGIAYLTNKIRLLNENINISTVVAFINIPIIFNIPHIGKYFRDFDDILINLVHNKVIYSIDGCKNHIKPVKINSKEFKSQITMSFSINGLLSTNNEKDKRISVKLYNNGGFHFTGLSNNFELIPIILKHLFDKFTKIRYLYCDSPRLLDICHVRKLQIHLLNTNFSIPYVINLTNIHNYLIENDYNSSYDPVDKNQIILIFNSYVYNSKATIFLHKSGKINVTGTNSFDVTEEAYHVIMKLLYTVENIIEHPIKNSTIKSILDTYNE